MSIKNTSANGGNTVENKRQSVTWSVDWSYPTSPNADRFGFKSGCYTVSTTKRTEKRIHPPEAVKGFLTRAEAEAFGNALPFPRKQSVI